MVIFVVAVMMEWDFTMDEKGYFGLFTKKENQPKKLLFHRKGYNCKNFQNLMQENLKCKYAKSRGYITINSNFNFRCLNETLDSYYFIY